MNGLGLTVMGPWPQFTVTLAFTSALTSATAGTVRSNASWTERANEDEGVAARAALAASTVAHRTLDARALEGAISVSLPIPGVSPPISELYPAIPQPIPSRYPYTRYTQATRSERISPLSFRVGFMSARATMQSL